MPCPQSTLAAIVAEFGDNWRHAEFGDSRRFWRESPKSATVAGFGDYSRQCGQGLDNVEIFAWKRRLLTDNTMQWIYEEVRATSVERITPADFWCQSLHSFHLISAAIMRSCWLINLYFCVQYCWYCFALLIIAFLFFCTLLLLFLHFVLITLVTINGQHWWAFAFSGSLLCLKGVGLFSCWLCLLYCLIVGCFVIFIC